MIDSAKRKKIINILLERDGNRCHYCGKEMCDNGTGEHFVNDGISIDHITPTSQGGTDDLINLILACRRCNVKKGIMSYHEFRLTMETNWMMLFLMGDYS